MGWPCTRAHRGGRLGTTNYADINAEPKVTGRRMSTIAESQDEALGLKPRWLSGIKSGLLSNLAILLKAMCTNLIEMEHIFKKIKKSYQMITTKCEISPDLISSQRFIDHLFCCMNDNGSILVLI